MQLMFGRRSFFSALLSTVTQGTCEQSCGAALPSAVLTYHPVTSL